jgi:hypothetical protein
MASAYRDLAAPSALEQLAAKGRELRAAAPADPHALRAPGEISDPRASALEHSAAALEDMAGPWMARRIFTNVVYYLVLIVMIVVLPLVMLAIAVLGKLFFPMFGAFVAAMIGVGMAVAHRRNQPRRWLSQIPLRVDGYLDTLGREERLVRTLAVIRFVPGTSPDLEFTKDVLTGARCPSQGVVALGPDTIGVHSPDLDGDAKRLHTWFQFLCDECLIPVHASYPIERVDLQER